MKLGKFGSKVLVGLFFIFYTVINASSDIRYSKSVPFDSQAAKELSWDEEKNTHFISFVDLPMFIQTI